MTLRDLIVGLAKAGYDLDETVFIRVVTRGPGATPTDVGSVIDSFTKIYDLDRIGFLSGGMFLVVESSTGRKE